jgi:hypothetical protein
VIKQLHVWESLPSQVPNIETRETNGSLQFVGYKKPLLNSELREKREVVEFIPTARYVGLSKALSFALPSISPVILPSLTRS